MAPGVREEFEAAWLALAHRFAAFSDACHALEAAHTERAQDAALFGAFSNGVACIESCCYGLFAIGAWLEPARFPLASPGDKRNATVGATMRQFGEVFHDAELTRVLFWWLNSREFGWWKETRTMLAQRVAPMSGAGWELRGVTLDVQTLREKRAWLGELLGTVLHEADVFVAEMAAKITTQNQ